VVNLPYNNLLWQQIHMLLASVLVSRTDPLADLCGLNAGSTLEVLSTETTTVTYIQTLSVFAYLVPRQCIKSFIYLFISSSI